MASKVRIALNLRWRGSLGIEEREGDRNK